MSDIEPIHFGPHGPTRQQPSGKGARRLQPVVFSRIELNQILNVYGRRVAAGDWRDYAIDMEKDKAVFSIFRRASEVPIYRIEKNPKLARRQGAFAVISATGQILKRGHDLPRVLSVLDSRAHRLKLVET